MKKKTTKKTKAPVKKKEKAPTPDSLVDEFDGIVDQELEIVNLPESRLDELRGKYPVEYGKLMKLKVHQALKFPLQKDSQVKRNYRYLFASNLLKIIHAETKLRFQYKTITVDGKEYGAFIRKPDGSSLFGGARGRIWTLPKKDDKSETEE